MFYLLTYAVALPSPVLLFMNAEAWVITNAYLAKADLRWLVAATVLGQLTTYTILHWQGPRVVDQLPWLKRKLDAFDASRYERSAHLTFLLACVVGFPPVFLFAALSKRLAITTPAFLALCSIGRTIRFTTLALLPETFATIFRAAL